MFWAQELHLDQLKRAHLFSAVSTGQREKLDFFFFPSNNKKKKKCVKY